MGSRVPIPNKPLFCLDISRTNIFVDNNGNMNNAVIIPQIARNKNIFCHLLFGLSCVIIAPTGAADAIPIIARIAANKNNKNVVWRK